MEEADKDAQEIASRWCDAQEGAWRIVDVAGRGGTAPVYTVSGPGGLYALKLFDAEFSEGEKGEESAKRIALQRERLESHDCPFIVKVYDGGIFENRLFLLMERAEGAELEKKLPEVPRDKIRSIVDQVARAAIYLRGIDLCHRDIKSANIFISDDFERVKLLDLSVLRDITDPVGIGTDHGDALPVVATSRYSPPDYLFRLHDPSPELWHALDVYQLGGLLHDLIMREPMFEAEYQKTKENRYRFAWVVATQEPVVRAADVDTDLLQLARRALDKDWQRRRSLRLEDFLEDAKVRRRRSMEALGARLHQNAQHQEQRQMSEGQFGEILTTTKNLVRSALSNEGITCQHVLLPATEGAWTRELEYRWRTNANSDEGISNAVLTQRVVVENLYLTPSFSQTLLLAGDVESVGRLAKVSLPARLLSEGISDELASDAVSNLPDLANDILRRSSEGEN